MKSHRIFIENLPETASETEIQSQFSKFGLVQSVEIKERKNVTFKHSSVFFAYVNIETDENRLQKCFQYFSEHPWIGEYVKLQIAKESFLERLKREREANLGKTSNVTTSAIEESKTTIQSSPDKLKTIENAAELHESKEYKNKSFKTTKQEKRAASPSSSESSDVKENNFKTFKNNESKSVEEFINEEPQLTEIVIKSNKGIKFSNNKLKIEGVGNKPIHNVPIVQEKPRSLDKFRTQADHRRIQSLLEKKKEYNHQKNAVKAALSYNNINKSNKIIFDQNEEMPIDNHMDNSDSKSTCAGNSQKTPLFDNDDESDEDTNKIFELREKFQGKAGEQLLKLQSTFKNDRRFVLDEKFLENDTQNVENNAEESELIDMEEEKKKEIEILGEVLGREVKSFHDSNEKHARSQNGIKVMRRFDPSHPDYAKYEREIDKTTIKKKKDNHSNEKKIENTEEPEVSKELFYEVREDLKKSLEEDKGFSLLNTFGISHEQDDIPAETETKLIEKKKYMNSENPFKYDSSDDEDQTEQLSLKEKPSSKVPNNIKSWSEPFFFQEDDFRLQEGKDFVKRLATEDKADFVEVRRNLKEIARNKIRMNLRKNRPFKKKLGGSRKKKVKRINKALKR